MWQRKHWVVFVTLLLVAVCFRISVAHWLANDNPDDGRVYAQIARDVLEPNQDARLSALHRGGLCGVWSLE